MAALERFTERMGTHATLGAEALGRLKAYAWPGNVRELMNVVERAVILAGGSGVIDDLELPRQIFLHREDESAHESAAPGTVRPLSDAVASAERAAILAALERTGDNKAQAARLLGVSVRTLFYKLEKLDLR